MAVRCQEAGLPPTRYTKTTLSAERRSDKHPNYSRAMMAGERNAMDARASARRRLRVAQDSSGAPA